MYWTAHRVTSPSGDEGINVFVHAHGTDFPWPNDAVELPDTNPGTTVDARTRVPPGGNRVRSYLDVLAPDGTPDDDVIQALREFARQLGGTPNPAVQRNDSVTLRFGTEIALDDQRGEELCVLADAIWPGLVLA